ncbi:DUF1870 family protein [Vibrio breoganii]|nr:hypothetical protein BCT84_12535 [Vibrio breoganii]
MSFEQLNGVELSVMRHELRLSIKEVSTTLGVSERLWRYWEMDERPMRPEIGDTMRMIMSEQTALLESIYAEIVNNPELEPDSLPWYPDYAVFCSLYPQRANPVAWRFYQSIVADMFVTLTTVTLHMDSRVQPVGALLGWLQITQKG